MNLLPRHKSKATGFTLVELLVSITVLSIILFSLAQAIGFVAQLWVNGVGAADNMTKARDVMSVMNRDIQQMVLRPDTAAFPYAAATGTQTTCAFYTSAQSNNTDTRSVSLVQYELNPSTQNGVLGRLTYGMNYSNTATPIVRNPPPTALSQLITSGTFTPEVLATGILEFKWQFVDGTGTVLTPPYIPTNSTSTTKTPFYFDYLNPRDVANPRAIVVSLVVLSNSAYSLASQNSTVMTNVQSYFDNVTLGTNQIWGAAWNTALNQPGPTFSTLPVPVRSGLRVFQQYIPLPVITPAS